VFGAASKRDETKRPLMGEISSKYADFIILTSEDPRKENPMKIIEDIEKGIPKTKITASERTLDEVPSKAVARIEDRAEAIRFAVKLAKKGDIVVITGKSHEKTMNINGVETPWNEYEVVKQALQQVTNNK
jgi:UDP-N-acetylmuramoyl-L-alanyl-D-glutamate--2,6-diaminopimelate ligase